MIKTGGTLDFTLSAQPDPSWGTDPADAPPSYTAGQLPAVGYSVPSGALTVTAGHAGGSPAGCGLGRRPGGDGRLARGSAPRRRDRVAVFGHPDLLLVRGGASITEEPAGHGNHAGHVSDRHHTAHSGGSEPPAGGGRRDRRELSHRRASPTLRTSLETRPLEQLGPSQQCPGADPCRSGVAHTGLCRPAGGVASLRPGTSAVGRLR